MALLAKVIHGRVKRALDFYNSESMWVGIGKTTPWDTAGGDNDPPEVTGDETFLTEPIGFKVLTTKHLVVPDSLGSILFNDVRWSVVDPADVFTLNPVHVYINTHIVGDELPTEDISFRQVGIFSGFTLSTSGVDAVEYGDESITDYGIMEILENRSPEYRDPNKNEEVLLMIEF